MYITMILKTLFIYFFIVVVYRIMGKKEVGQLGIIDLIVSILIAELGVLSIESKDATILISVIPITVIVLIQLGVGYLSIKNTSLRRMIDGRPSVIIKQGKLNFNEMTKLRYTLDDLVSQLREQGIKSIEEVDYAVLENNGKLSIFGKTKDYPLPIILDGRIDLNVLDEIDKDEMWIYKLLKENDVKVEDIFYAFYTSNKTFIIRKNELL